MQLILAAVDLISILAEYRIYHGCQNRFDWHDNKTNNLRIHHAVFGFTPSEGLLNDIQTGIANKNSSEPLYPLRDKIALQLNEEIIENVLTQLVQHFPASEKEILPKN